MPLIAALWRRLHTLVQHGAESNVPADQHVARGGEHGGSPVRGSGWDATATTGTAESQPFVGRAAGVDVGYAGETGAEARGEAPDKDVHHG